MRKLFAGLIISSTLVLTACNTVAGAGEDLESASETVEEEINE